MSYRRNILAYTIYEFTFSRLYWPLLSIYFLTLQGTDISQVGLFIALSFVTGFLLEVPSGYLSDRVGYRKTLIISSGFLAFSTLTMIVATSWYYFLVSALFMGIAMSFSSGAKAAFLHTTLASMKRTKEYLKLRSRISANGALFRAALIFLLPFTSVYSIKIPFIISFLLHITAMAAMVFSVEPKIHQKHKKKEYFSFSILLSEKFRPFIFLSIFLGVIWGILKGESIYKPLFLEFLGLPIVYLGLITSLPLFLYFILGNLVSILNPKINLRRLLFLEVIVFGGFYLLLSTLTNPYVALLAIVVVNGYMQARVPLYETHILEAYSSKDTKATILSVSNQFALVFQVVSAILLGYLFEIFSFHQSYFYIGIGMLTILLLNFLIIVRKKN